MVQTTWIRTSEGSHGKQVPVALPETCCEETLNGVVERGVCVDLIDLERADTALFIIHTCTALPV